MLSDTSQVVETASGCITYSYKLASGRPEWLSRDPIAESGGINLYGYVANNPINSLDPDGKDTITWSINFSANAGASSIGAPSGGFGGSLGVGLSYNWWGPIPYPTDAGIVTDSSTTNAYTGAGYGATLSATASTACSLNDLEGATKVASVDLGLPEGAGPIGGASIGMGTQRNGDPYFSLGAEAGLGGESFGGLGLSTSHTSVYSVGDIFGW
jgi:RHS repeat-associated protein